MPDDLAGAAAIAASISARKTILDNMCDTIRRRGDARNSRDVTVTPEIAATWLDRFNYVGQRHRSVSHVRFLADKIRSGEYRDYSDIHFAFADDRPHLINGQHTLNAIMVADQPQKLCVHVDACSSMLKVASMFAKHDVNRPRHMRDFTRKTAKDLNFTGENGNAYQGGVRRIHCRFTTNKKAPLKVEADRDADFVNAIMLDWVDEAEQYFDCIAGTAKYLQKPLRRADFVGVGLITFRHHPQVAAEFWGGIARDDGLRQRDPRKTLLNWALQNRSEGAFGLVHHRAVIPCWNAWYGKRALGSIYTGTNASMNIAGCDFVCDG